MYDALLRHVYFWRADMIGLLLTGLVGFGSETGVWK